MSNQDHTPSAVERADALLTRWEQSLTPGRARRPTAPSARGSAGTGSTATQTGGRGVLWPVARGYVWLSATVQGVVGPVQQSWQKSVAEARREQEQQAARRGGPGAAHREESQERQGEGEVKKGAGATAEAAGTAADVAGA